MHILTKDKDFKDIQELRGFPPKIIWLRIGNCSTQEFIELINKNFAEIKSFLINKNIKILEIN